MAQTGSSPATATSAPAAGAGASLLVRHALGPSLGQCCGGIAHLVFEVVRQAQPGAAQPGEVHHGPAGLAGAAHVNQGAAAGIGRHAAVAASEPQGAAGAGLGRHGTVKDETPQ